MTTDTRNAKGWPTVFADGRGVASAMASIYTGASGGAHLRGLYAAFLDEAADLLSRPPLRDAASAWREAAAAWDVIVDTALPPGDELRALIDAGDHEARWALQAQRDLAAGLPSLAEPVTGDVRGRGRGAQVTGIRGGPGSLSGIRAISGGTGQVMPRGGNSSAVLRRKSGGG